MSEKTFEVAFSGQLVRGAEPARVKTNLARLFKTNIARVEALFSGNRIVVKRGLDEKTARSYQAALRKAGAIVEVVDSAAQSVFPSKQRAQAPAPMEGQKRAPGGSTTAASISVAEPGALLAEPKEVRAPDIDTSQLSLAEVGAILTEPREVPEPEYDLSAFQLAPPGTRLSEPKEEPEVQFDTSQFSLA
jgi:hypothetical protein